MIIIGTPELRALMGLVDVREEVFGSLVYKRVCVRECVADVVFGMVPNVIGTSMNFTIDQPRLEKLSYFVKGGSGLDAFEFHTHTKSTVRLCGERAARELSSEDRGFIYYRARKVKEEGRHGYRHLLITPEVWTVYGMVGRDVVRQRMFEMVGRRDGELYDEIERLHQKYAPRLEDAKIPFCRSLDDLAVTRE